MTVLSPCLMVFLKLDSLNARPVIMYQGGCFCRILLSGGAATLPLYCYNLLVIRASSMLIYRQYIHPSRPRQNLPKRDKGRRQKIVLQRTFSRRTAILCDWCLTPSHIARDCVKIHRRTNIFWCFQMSLVSALNYTLISDLYCSCLSFAFKQINK